MTRALVAACLLAAIAVPSASASVRVTVHRHEVVGKSRLALGVTHTQHSLDPWGDPAATARGRKLLSGVADYQDQAIYGWGTVNPNPSPGVYDWHSLDRRIELIRETGGTPVVTLCCAPDWMTPGGRPTTTYPNVPPAASHYDDFAKLARRVALRYPDVRHYMVWNEMKGFWDRDAGNWDYVAYTRMYNAVYDALKSVNPAIRVGGPYLVIEGTGSRSLGLDGWETDEPITDRNREVLDYWLAHKHGADFLAVDRKTVGRSHDLNAYTAAQELSFTRWFGVVTERLRELTRLPVWYAEDYFIDSGDWQFQAAGLASMLRNHVVAGASVSFRWGPQAKAADQPFGGNEQNLFSDTLVPGGGRPYPAYRVYRAFHRYFERGTRLVRAASSSSTLEVLASRRTTLLVNERNRPVRVKIGRRSVRVSRYGVRVLRP